MKFVQIPTVTEEGEVKCIPVNPNQVVMIIPIPIPTGLTASDGKTPMVKIGTGVCLSNGQIIPCKSLEEEIIKLLENHA